MDFNSYKIKVASKFEKNLEKNLTKEVKNVFDKKLEFFSKNCYYPSLNTKKYNVSPKKLKELAVDEVWEFYIDRKKYRCIFYVDHKEEIIILAYVGNHKQIKNKYSK